MTRGELIKKLRTDAKIGDSGCTCIDYSPAMIREIADHIEKLEAELKASQMASHILGDRYNVLKEARRK